MQKKTKSRLVDFLVVIICLAGSALSVWQFWKELNRTLVKLNDEPIATITFKYNTAQRKFSDDLVWDRLRQNSPVYNGDTIRTADFSEATIYFNDGNIMDLSENTMARVSLNSGGGAAIDFSGGQIAVQTSDSGLTITSGSSVVDVVKGASVTASSVSAESAGKDSDGKTEDVFRVQVQSGSAEVSNGSQAISLDAGTAADMKGDGNVVRKKLSVLSPDPEYKLINFDDDEIPVDFRWDSEGEDVVVEFSETKNFASIREAYEYSGTDHVSMMLPSGTHYWRVRSGEEMLNGKITVYASKAPSAIAPVEDYTARYRSVKPSIRFIWSESERSTTYAFEVADNAEMQNPVISQRIQQTSSIVTTLDEGRWYWRVTPYYTINNIGFSHPSEVYSFSIQKSGALEAPELQLPKSGAVVTTKLPESAGGGAQNILFSWKDNPEAASYTVTITPDSSSYGSEIVQTVTGNYYSLDTSENQIGNGSWKWSVKMADVEGNVVESEKITFLAMDSEISQKVLFPGEGYYLSSTRVRDTNFVWKSNLASDMEVQFSNDPSFRNIVTSLTTKNTTASGFDLPVGSYYWRVISNTEAGMFMSDPVHFEVESPLPAPVCVNPEEGSRVVVENDMTIALKWKPVATANYYQLKVYGSDDVNDVIYENTYIEDDGRSEFTEYVSFDGRGEQTYYWSVQAYRDESENMSRAVGTLGKYDFYLRILKPITLLAPRDRTVFEGLEIVMNPPDMEWNSIDELSESELLIYKDSIKEENVVAVIQKPDQKVTMPRLYEGSYFWTVHGITLDELDVSSKQSRNFVINAIPPMDVPVVVSPVEDRVFGTGYFESSSKVTFSWKPVLYATKYIFTLFDENGTVINTADIPSPQVSYDVDFDDFGHAGNFTWTVEARTIFDDGVIRYGNKELSEFRISLPDMDAPVKNPVGTENVLTENLYHIDRNIKFSWAPVQYADEYIFTLKNADGSEIVKESLLGQKASAASRNAYPETSFVFNDVDSLEAGTYLWSVEARNYINGRMMQPGKSSDSSFTIKINNMAPPEKEYPVSGQVFSTELFDADAGLNFAWKEVEFADEYVFRLYDYDGNLVLEQPTEETRFVYTDLESLKKAKYSWTVEARSYLNGKLLQNGDVKETQFEIYLPVLKAPEKIAPDNGLILGTSFFVGDEKLTFRWKSIKYADEYIFKLTAPDGKAIIENSITDKVSSELSYTVPCDMLIEQGNYSWSVEALVHYHGNVIQNSAKEESSFAVVIPDLDSPVKDYPTGGMLFGSELFKADEGLRFVWRPTEFAEEYVLRLYNYDGNVVFEQITTETEFVYTDLDSLAKGKYSWDVEARRDLKGRVLNSKSSKTEQFEIYLPLFKAPEKTSPAEGYTLGADFYVNNEELSFKWKKIRYADEYVFTLKDPDGEILKEERIPDKAMANELSYTIICDELWKHGEYRWSVKALMYYHGKLIQDGTAEESSFSIIVPDLDPPKTLLPNEGTVFETAFFKKDMPQTFSWNAVPLADEYVFKLYAPDGSMITEQSCEETSVTIDDALFIKEGDYTWTVEARSHYKNNILQNGVVSSTHFSTSIPLLAAPVLTAPSSEAEYNSTYFKNNYTQSFSWEAVQFADEYVFHIEKADGSLVSEVILPADTLSTEVETELFSYEGNYSWSVEARAYFREKIMQTGNKAESLFSVVMPRLAEPDDRFPADGAQYGLKLLMEDNYIDFSWKPVDTADCYVLNISGPNGSVVKDTLFLAEDVGADGKFKYREDASAFATEGTYNWTVEARVMYNGRIIQSSGNVLNAFDVSLPNPDAPQMISSTELLVDAEYITNNDAVRLNWKSVKYAKEYKVVLYDIDGSLKKEITVSAFNDSPTAVLMLSEVLSPGTYTWTIEAMIPYMNKPFLYSEKAEGHIITEYPQLPAATISAPKNNEVLDVSYFRQSREIVFSWKPVKYAGGYRFAFYDEDGTLLMRQDLDANTTEVRFSELTSLKQGSFRWTVEAYFSKNKVVLAEGDVAESEFKIELPTLRTPTIEETGRLYGN